MEKVVDNEDLMECITGDSVMLVASKIFKLPERKKCMETNNLSTRNRDCISAPQLTS